MKTRRLSNIRFLVRVFLFCMWTGISSSWSCILRGWRKLCEELLSWNGGEKSYEYQCVKVISIKHSGKNLNCAQLHKIPLQDRICWTKPYSPTRLSPCSRLARTFFSRASDERSDQKTRKGRAVWVRRTRRALSRKREMLSNYSTCSIHYGKRKVHFLVSRSAARFPTVVIYSQNFR